MAKVFQDVLLYSIPEEIITEISLFGISGVKNLHNVSLVSKTFHAVFFREFHMEQILKRNFTKQIFGFLYFLDHCGEPDKRVFMTSLYKYLAKYRYCISGSFALSVIDGINNRNDQHWRNGDIDIYVSLPKTNANRFRDFHSGLATWWRNIRYLFHYSRVKVEFYSNIDYCKIWSPAPTFKHFVQGVYSFKIIGQFGQRTIQFIILDTRYHISPTLFVTTKFDFTFLLNSIRFDNTGNFCLFQIMHLDHIISKSGSYTPFFLKHWSLEWKLWQIAKGSTDQELLNYHIARRKTIRRLKERRQKYHMRGYAITGLIPKGKFYFDRNISPYVNNSHK
jgi:hypothetical protein